MFALSRAPIQTHHSNAVRADLVGRCFVLGRPNARNEQVIVFGDTRWLIDSDDPLMPGQRVRVVAQLGDTLRVEKADVILRD